jgi:glycosyltransferase involved in cell wall biosynthesis
MISIVVPIYNEAENLDQLFRRIRAASETWSEPFEVILVDDGSHDASPDMLRTIADRDARFKVVTFSRNFGHQAAISAGLRFATGDAVVIMDGDLQDPPEQLARFLEKWHQGYHVVYAIRTERKENLLKRTAYQGFYRALRLVGDIDIPLDSGDFCLLDRRVRDVLVDEMPEQNRFVRGLRVYAGFRQIGVAYERQERAAGETKYTFRRLVHLALDGLIDFSAFPLRIASWLGFLIAVPSFLIGVFIIFHRIVGFKIFGYAPGDTPGLATLAVGMFFLGGVTLVMLGIIGEYLGRIYREVKRRPQFIVQSVYRRNDDESRPS